jgi:GTP cyclohydrolase II
MSSIRLVPAAPRNLNVVEKYSESTLPTEHGPLRVVVFREVDSARDPKAVPIEHVAIIAGNVADVPQPVAVRVHSECWTGEVLGSLKCDCRAQLDHALDFIAARGQGVVLYLKQEGRGIGLGNKIRAYALQERGVDTVDANRQLGFADDARIYDAAACMLKQLRVQAVELVTNNPAKINALRALGIDVVGRIESVMPANPHSSGYLDTKRVRMGHLLAGPVAPGQTRPL